MHACCCIVEKKQNSFFFWILDEKKAYQHWYFFSLKKDYSRVRFFSPLIIVTRRNIRRIRLACLAMVKKVSKKKPFCSKVCLCIQTFSTWYYRKKFQSVDHYARGEKVHKGVGISKPSICNSFWNWCQKLRKMMDIDASRECSIFVPKLSECLNWLFQLIYFLVTVSIFGFRRMRSQNLT